VQVLFGHFLKQNKMAIERKPPNNPYEISYLGLYFPHNWRVLLKEKDKGLDGRWRTTAVLAVAINLVFVYCLIVS